MPSRILASGLGQTLAFAASKKGVDLEVTNVLAKFLTRPANMDSLGLLKQVMEGSVGAYRQMTREAVYYAEGLKRYAVALIDAQERA